MDRRSDPQKTRQRKRCAIKSWTGCRLKVVGLACMKLLPHISSKKGFMTIIGKILMVVIVAAVGGGSVALADERIVLSENWRFQPAVDSNTPPDAKEWGTTASTKGTSWEKRNRREVDSWWYEQSLAIPVGARHRNGR